MLERDGQIVWLDPGMLCGQEGVFLNSVCVLGLRHWEAVWQLGFTHMGRHAESADMPYSLLSANTYQLISLAQVHRICKQTRFTFD